MLPLPALEPALLWVWFESFWWCVRKLDHPVFDTLLLISAPQPSRRKWTFYYIRKAKKLTVLIYILCLFCYVSWLLPWIVDHHCLLFQKEQHSRTYSIIFELFESLHRQPALLFELRRVNNFHYRLVCWFWTVSDKDLTIHFRDVGLCPIITILVHTSSRLFINRVF